MISGSNDEGGNVEYVDLFVDHFTGQKLSAVKILGKFEKVDLDRLKCFDRQAVFGDCSGKAGTAFALKLSGHVTVT
jgi:hypothetical protein